MIVESLCDYPSSTDTFDLLVDPKHKRPSYSFALYTSWLKLGSFWLSYLVLPLSLKHLVTPKTLEPRSDDGHTTKLSFESVLMTLLSMSFDLRRRTIRKTLEVQYKSQNNKTQIFDYQNKIKFYFSPLWEQWRDLKVQFVLLEGRRYVQTTFLGQRNSPAQAVPLDTMFSWKW